MFRKSPSRHNFLYLFAGLALFMTVLPVIAEFSQVANTLVTELSLTLVLLVGVWSLEGNRWIFRAGLALVIITVVLSFSYYFRPHVGIVHAVRVLSVVFLLLSAVITFRSVFLAGEVDLNRLAGAASLYLIIALIWALLYSLLYAVAPPVHVGPSRAPQPVGLSVFQSNHANDTGLRRCVAGECSCADAGGG